MGIQNIGTIVRDGLVFYVDAANNQSFVSSSTTWTDLSYRHLTGSLVGSASYFAEQGKSAINFDGTMSIVPFTCSVGASEGTLACWVKAGNLNDNFFTYTTGNTGSSYSHQIGVGYSWTLTGYIYDTDVGTRLLNGGTLVKDKWHYCAMAWKDGSYQALYVDGQFVTSGSMLSSWKGGSYFILGSRTGTGFANSFKFLSGSLSSVQVYNRALSTPEILQNYNSQKARYL